MKKRKIIVGITGASGSVYAKVLLEKIFSLKNQIDSVGITMSDNAKEVWTHELPHIPLPFRVKKEKFIFYGKNDFTAPFASGSSDFIAMIVCPCSMGTLGRIAGGISNDLITRAADVMLKERRKLILVTREFPINLIHINNMKIVTEAGGIICPASPSFYNNPKEIEQLVSTVIDRVLDLCDFEVKIQRWGRGGLRKKV